MTLPARGSGALAFAWAGALLFLVSLLYCVVSYEGTMGRIAGAQFDILTNVSINVALFSAFALHHSLFARDSARHRIQRVVSPALERSVYVWVASLMLIVVCAAWRPVHGVLWEVTGPAAWLLRCIQAAGVWLTIRSAAAIDVLELAGVRQAQIPNPESQIPKSGQEFKTTGPYGWVRHPIYSGWFLIVFADPLMTATRATFAIVSGLYLLLAIPFEERSLLAGTSGAYARYARRVKWRLVPYLY